MKTADKFDKLSRRKRRVRQRIFGTPERPRLNVYRSKGHIYAQIINDLTGRTLVAASTLDPELRKALKSTATIEAAKAVGQLLATRAKAVSLESVVFDRGGRLYHGRIKALAEASRTSGLKF
jgi:large subunit ribosomal protein L18